MLTFEDLTVDAVDPVRLASFWADLLGYATREDGVEWWVSPAKGGPSILFLPSSDPRTVKNRLHLDLRSDDQAADVARALALGARHIDVGQTGDESWVVLADPEGNEFCILAPEE